MCGQADKSVQLPVRPRDLIGVGREFNLLLYAIVICRLTIGYYTGLRISEAFGLTWDDINFENHTLIVSKTILKRNYGVDVRKVLEQKGKKEEKSAWYFSTTKTESSNRTVKFGDTLYSALKHAHTSQKKNRLIYGEYYTEHYLKPEKDEKENTIHRIIPVERCIKCALKKVDMICVRENGEYISTDSFKYCSRIIHNELKLAFDYHSLRHSYVKTTLKNKSLQKQNPKPPKELLVWDF